MAFLDHHGLFAKTPLPFLLINPQSITKSKKRFARRNSNRTSLILISRSPPSHPISYHRSRRRPLLRRVGYHHEQTQSVAITTLHRYHLLECCLAAVALFPDNTKPKTSMAVRVEMKKSEEGTMAATSTMDADAESTWSSVSFFIPAPLLMLVAPQASLCSQAPPRISTAPSGDPRLLLPAPVLLLPASYDPQLRRLGMMTRCCSFLSLGTHGWGRPPMAATPQPGSSWPVQQATLHPAHPARFAGGWRRHD